MPDLRVSIVQSMLRWEDATGNRVMFTEKLAVLKGTTDLVVLPEMFTTGFSMRSAELAEAMDGPTLSWMREQAAMLDAALYGSAIIADRGGYFNRGLFVRPDGQVTVYDKRHLFRFANEHEHFAPGQERVVVDWRGWRILLQICFDLRFPVFARNRRVVGHNDYDLVLYVANWPERRSHAWKTLLCARAIENQCYVMGVNRVGNDGNGIYHSGNTMVIDPLGEVLYHLKDEEDCFTISLEKEHLQQVREKFPFWKDGDNFKIY